MAARVIISDSEDEENVPIRTIRPCRTNRVIYSDEESITDESDVSYVGTEEELNEIHSPLQVAHKRAPGQRISVSDDDDEEGQTDTTTSNASHNSSTSSHDSSASEFSKPQGDLEDSNSPMRTNYLTTPKQQVIDLGDGDETDTARTYIPSSLPAEETPRETNGEKAAIGKEIIEKGKEVVRIETLEKDKENKSPAGPQLPTAPEKPSLLSQQGPVSHPVVQPLKAPPKVAAMAPNRPINDTFSVAHTRPALLKQLEYVKVRISFYLFVVLQSISEASCYYWCKPS